jgi:hypothetical protein
MYEGPWARRRARQYKQDGSKQNLARNGGGGGGIVSQVTTGFINEEMESRIVTNDDLYI